MPEASGIDRDEMAPTTTLPTDTDLQGGLRAVVGSDLTVLRREPSRYSSTFATERVSASTESGPLDLLCKYGSGYRNQVSGHRRGVDYEASMYEHLLPDGNLNTPLYHGAFRTEDSTRCLVLEYIDGYRVHHSPYPQGLLWICTDLARFHAQGTRPIPVPLNTFDRTYFTGWAGEIATLARRGGQIGRVIARLDGSMYDVIDLLCLAPRSIVHGELYPDNVIVHESGTVVIDWESAGVGPGVLDLAVLTQGRWDPDLVFECEAAYWSSIGISDREQAARSLAAARVFAAAQLLHQLTGKDEVAHREALAADEVMTQLSFLASAAPR